MKHFALTVALLAAPCVAAPTLTTIVDTLYKADGTRFEGVAQIEWKSFQAADGSEIPQQTLNVKVVSGNLRVALVPTVNASKPVHLYGQIQQQWPHPIYRILVRAGQHDAPSITECPVAVASRPDHFAGPSHD